MTAYQLLQRSLVPDAGFTEPELYVRNDHAADVLTFDTSFGVFHAGRWRRLTTVDGLTARVVASGEGRAEVVAVTRGRETVLASAQLTSEHVDIDLGSLRSSAWGVLYVRVVGASGCRVQRVEWLTETQPAHEVRLSLSITTFNRQAYVIPTVKKVLSLVRGLDSLRGRVRVLVVDNASNVDFGKGTDADLAQLVEVGTSICPGDFPHASSARLGLAAVPFPYKMNTICFVGPSAYAPINSALVLFPEEFAARVTKRTMIPVTAVGAAS